MGQNRSTQRYQPIPPDFEVRLVKRMNELVTERRLLSRVWDTVHIAPPLVVTREEIDRIVGILDDSLTIAERENGLV